MLLRNRSRFSNLLLLSALFLSIIPTLFFVIWLIPQLVFVWAIFSILVAILSIWIMERGNFLSAFIEQIKNNCFILPFLIFSGISVIWSIYWEVSLLRWLILLCTITVAGFIGLEYELKEYVDKLAVFGIFILLLSTLIVIFIPRLGIMNYHNIQGAWRGIFWHKNHMGFMASFFNVLFLIKLIAAIQSRQRNMFLWAVCYLGSLTILYLSDSIGAFLTTIFLYGVLLLALLFLKFRKKIKKSHYLFFIAAIILVVLILYSNLDAFFAIFNRNTTLTGRIPMWTYVLNTYISKQPLFGYGFNAFWFIQAHRVAIQYAAGYPDQIVISDNGFIDLILNTGYVGFACFLLFYLGAWWVSIQHAWKASNVIGFFPIMLMVFTLVANISWSLLFENESFFFLVMVSVIFCISATNPAKAVNPV